jgi:tetratricopeptide (TPR) repeat protein
MRQLLAGLLAVAMTGLALGQSADEKYCAGSAGSADERIAACNRAIASGALKPEALGNVLVRRGLGWLNKGDYGRAIADYDEAIRLTPENWSALYERGSAWSAKSEYERAIADFSEAIRLKPDYALAYKDRGIAWAGKGDRVRAIADYSEAIRLDPKQVRAYVARSASWRNRGDYDRAIADANEAIRLNPEYAGAYLARGNAWRSKGDKGRMMADFSEALRLDPENPLANNVLAWELAVSRDDAVRDGQRAVRYARKACELKDWKDAFYLDTLAAALAAVGNFREAIRWQERALEDPELSQSAQARLRLELYRAGKSYRE